MSWEYRDDKVSVSAMYKSAVEVKDAVKRWGHPYFVERGHGSEKFFTYI
jgi:hypothetical protein